MAVALMLINLVINVASLSSINFVKNEEEYVVRCCSLADKRHVRSKVKSSFSDCAKLQYKECTNYVNILCKDEFFKLNFVSDRLNTVLRVYLSDETEYIKAYGQFYFSIHIIS